MTATSHAVIGTIIAAKIGNPYIAIPIALLSHIAADIFPHWDAATNGRKKDKKRLIAEAAGDVLLGFVISYVILVILFPQTSLLYAFIMIIVSQSLDWATSPYYFFHVQTPPFIWFYRFQSRFHTRLDKPWGIISQIAIILLLILLAKFF